VLACAHAAHAGEADLAFSPDNSDLFALLTGVTGGVAKRTIATEKSDNAKPTRRDR
jgi:hypothetical protein